jgi:hypothetical protein
MNRLETALMTSADCVVCISEATAEAARRITDTPVRVLSTWGECLPMIRKAARR